MLEGGRALFGEGGHAFLLVLGPEQPGEQPSAKARQGGDVGRSGRQRGAARKREVPAVRIAPVQVQLPDPAPLQVKPVLPGVGPFGFAAGVTGVAVIVPKHQPLPMNVAGDEA